MSVEILSMNYRVLEYGNYKKTIDLQLDWKYARFMYESKDWRRIMHK